MTRMFWAGFSRRATAFYLDLWILSLLSWLLFNLLYAAYAVGLAAHHQPLSLDRLEVFLWIYLFCWFSLVTAYFVLFHALEGQTIGKWLLGIKVVGPDKKPVTYGQAAVRWMGFLASALSGLGLLWILWHKEKRGWHDLLADTWAIREE